MAAMGGTSAPRGGLMTKNLLDPFRITNGRKFRLTNVRPDDTRGLKSKEDARKDLEKGIERLAGLQEKLYAQDQWGVLPIFQAMDAAGRR
jgi:polyphosphate kinase 2 (PPK2 family)